MALYLISLQPPRFPAQKAAPRPEFDHPLPRPLACAAAGASGTPNPAPVRSPTHARSRARARAAPSRFCKNGALRIGSSARRERMTDIADVSSRQDGALISSRLISSAPAGPPGASGTPSSAPLGGHAHTPATPPCPGPVSPSVKRRVFRVGDGPARPMRAGACKGLPVKDAHSHTQRVSRATVWRRTVAVGGGGGGGGEGFVGDGGGGGNRALFGISRGSAASKDAFSPARP